MFPRRYALRRISYFLGYMLGIFYLTHSLETELYFSVCDIELNTLSKMLPVSISVIMSRCRSPYWILIYTYQVNASGLVEGACTFPRSLGFSIANMDAFLGKISAEESLAYILIVIMVLFFILTVQVFYSINLRKANSSDECYSSSWRSRALKKVYMKMPIGYIDFKMLSPPTSSF